MKIANAWHQRFSTEEYVYGKEPNAFVVEAAKQLPKFEKEMREDNEWTKS